jgi:hypothetical protein
MTRCGARATGAVYSVPGAYYLAGLVLLAKLGEPAATNVLAILGFNLIMFALVGLPPIGFVLTPDRTRPLTKKRNGWITDHPADIDIDRGRSRRDRPHQAVRVVSQPPSGPAVASASVVSWNQACRPAPS